LLFDRCSVFTGGWTLEAAEAVVAGDGIDTLAVLDLLCRLADKSLVVVELASTDAVRYRMLETLREYGRHQLRQRGQREVEFTERRHVDFFAVLIDRAHAQFGSIVEGWLAPLGREQDNFRTARWSIAAGDAEATQRVAGGLFPFWLVRGHLSEGRARALTIRAWTIGTTGDFGDPHQAWASTYGVGNDGAVLIRPDGYVAWRSSGVVSDPRAELTNVLYSVLGHACPRR
jgi:predicted ATPase